MDISELIVGNNERKMMNLQNSEYFDKHHKRFRRNRSQIINFKSKSNSNTSTNCYRNTNFNNFNNFNYIYNNFKLINETIVILIVLISSHFILPINCGCRVQERNDCERVCVRNVTGHLECKLRAIVIMPNVTTVEASLPRVLPVLTIAEAKVRELKIIPDYLLIDWIAYDDKCDPSYASISAMDGYGLDCAHVLFGPTCDYALAPVGRVVKYFRMDGTPLITGGGYSADFVTNKTTCDQEYHMLTRTGVLSFQAISDFFLALMNKYKWSQAVLFFDRSAHYRVAGKHTCHLFMQAMAGMFRDNNLTFTSYATAATTNNMNMTENLKKEVGLDKSNAFLGPISDYVIAPISRYCGVWEIPILTTGGIAPNFNLKTNYPTLTRMLGSYTQVGLAFQSMLKEFHWNLFALLYHNHSPAAGKGNSECYFTLSIICTNLKCSTVQNFDQLQANHTDFLNMLKIIKAGARIVVMCANPTTIREIMLAAEELNMVDSGEYVFFNIELFDSLTATTTQPWYNETDTEANNLRARKAYTALLTVIAKQPDASKEYSTFSDEVKDLAAAKYNYTFSENEPVSPFVTAFYDAVILYAYALNKSITEDPDVLLQPMNGTKMIELMWNTHFRGITGNVTIDSNGDRISDYSLLDMNPDTGYFEVVANYFNKTGLQYVNEKTIHWAGGKVEPPLDKPVCGFDNSLCPDTSLPGYAILSLILGFAVIVLIIISILGYRHYRLEAEINSMVWRINFNDVLPCNPTSRHRGSLYSFTNRRGSHLTIASDESGSVAGDKQLYIPIGFYKGCKVAIKTIEETNINLNRSQMLELKRMKDMQHDHLVRFYGACVDAPNCCILTEYCPKGSLQDILENDQIKLDWMFKLSLMHDIVRGMHFLHSTDIRSHGNLKSSNCVVDSRFVLKITDFGLHQMRKAHTEDDLENSDSFAYWRKYLWTAPELLRLQEPPAYGTQKGDIYSFGIIVHEISTRQGPFYLGNDDKSPKEIIQLVKNGPKTLNCPPFRPKIEDTTVDDINNIMIKCWNEEPNERPDFGVLKTTIRKINKENETGNIVDNLLQRMEQYANNLEGLVEERTQDYLEEKKKCEELLYQLLPKSVAAQLIFGKPVIAEVFEQVTIYFSDIVGFTAISAASTPMQVVDLLNDLYTCFDSIVENFDVYKVETIGDAYMVVSGLPVRNGYSHAREIARLAIALLNNVYKFKIRHRPNEQLKLRIGLHSGSCVAGVVGLKMPRYCLFGDTVNTASRMESNGAALKIHVSETTKIILDKYETFVLEERGLVEMKGKGKMLTYWLIGENDNKVQQEIGPPPLLADDQQALLHQPQQQQQQQQNSQSQQLQSPAHCHQQQLQNTQQMALMNNNNNNINNTSNGDTETAGILLTGIKANGTTTPNFVNNNKQPSSNDNKKPTIIHFNSFVKANNLKNQYKKKFSVGEDNIRNVTQPLLGRINS